MPIRTQTRRYRITAFYEHPELERNAIVEAESAERAMVKALLERKVPAGFTRDEFGWIQPEFWRPEMAGGLRWPHIQAGGVLVWGDMANPRTLRFEIEEAV